MCLLAWLMSRVCLPYKTQWLGIYIVFAQCYMCLNCSECCLFQEGSSLPSKCLLACIVKSAKTVLESRQWAINLCLKNIDTGHVDQKSLALLLSCSLALLLSCSAFRYSSCLKILLSWLIIYLLAFFPIPLTDYSVVTSASVSIFILIYFIWKIACVLFKVKYYSTARFILYGYWLMRMKC